MTYQSLNGKIYKDEKEIFNAINLYLVKNSHDGVDNWGEAENLLYVCAQCMVNYDRSLIGSRSGKE